MLTFKLGETDGGHAGVVLRSESSHQAIDKLSELGLALAKPPPAKADEISPTALLPEKIVRFYSDGQKLQRWNVLISTLPLSLVLGLGYYLLFTDEPRTFASAVMLAGLVVFALSGCLLERQMLKAFACPGCQASIEDWDTDETQRILTHCSRCGSRWDIEYQLRPGTYPPRKKRRRPSDFSILCGPRGAH